MSNAPEMFLFSLFTFSLIKLFGSLIFLLYINCVIWYSDVFTDITIND